MAAQKNIILDKTIRFSLEMIEVHKRLVNENDYILSKQLLRSSTSIGANAHEAISASSRKDFAHKFIIAQKEARETQYWLILLQESQIVQYDYSKHLMEIDEIIRIISSIIRSTQQSNS